MDITYTSCLLSREPDRLRWRRLALTALLLAVTGWVWPTVSPAEAPPIIGYHGRLLDAVGHPLSTNVWIDVELHTNAVSGAPLYQQAIGTVPVNNGLYHFQFGDASLLDAGLGEHAELWLEVHVNAAPLLPRQRLLSVPYAWHAATAAAVETGAIATHMLANGAVTAEKIAPGAIGAEQISDNAWTGMETGAALRVTAQGERFSYSDITQAWAAVQSGDVLYVLPGTYEVDAGYTRRFPELTQAPLTLTGLQDISIIGLGNARIHATNEGHHLVFDNCTNVVVRGLTLSGERTPVNTHTYGGICLVDDVRHMLITSCTFRDLPNHGVITRHTSNTRSSEYVTIRDNLFLRGGAYLHGWIGQVDGAAIADLGARWQVINNDIVGWVRGVEIFCKHHNVDVVDVLVADNRFYDSFDNALMIIDGKRGDQIRNVTVRNNHFRGMRRNAINIRAGRNLLIEGNQIDGGGTGYRGIYFHTAKAVANVVIRNNQITRVPSSGIYLSRTGFDLSNVVVADNMIWECGYHGIETPDTGCIVENNTLLNNGWNGNFRSGILITPTLPSGHPTIVRNNWVANQGTDNTKHGIRLLPGSTQEVVIACNTVLHAMQNDYTIQSASARLIRCDGDNLEAGDIHARGKLSGDGGGLTNLPASEVQGLRSGRIIVEVGETQAAHAFAAAYASTPVVVATPRDPHGQHNLAVTLVDVSPSSFVVSVTALDGSAWGDPIEIDWIALGL